jgi:MoaA/NifB/PqqE/SkfB family radical SAM enzyme
LKNDGYSFLKVVSGNFEDTHACLRKEGWEEYVVAFSEPLESLYTRLFVANFPVNWKPHTFPIDKKIFVKKVDGIKPGEVSKSFYWLENVDIYNTTKCNYRCGHCMAADVMKEGKIQMDEQMFLKLLDDLEGVESVHIAGQGETSLYPNFLNILNRASKKVLEVRMNTNGSFIPTEKEEAKKLFESLPKNTHIFLSIDKYHERQDTDLRQRVELLKEYSKAYGFKVSFNVRVRDKYSDEKNQLTRKYQIQEYPVIVNRVLNQGRGRRIPDTRYVILEKLLYNIANKPSVGILPDGTVITNFITAYLPKSARPSCGSVGNIREEDLPTIIKRYEQLIGAIIGHESAMLRSMDAEVGNRYPYVKNN